MVAVTIIFHLVSSLSFSVLFLLFIPFSILKQEDIFYNINLIMSLPTTLRIKFNLLIAYDIFHDLVIPSLSSYITWNDSS